jgi:hypothetical protein
MQPRGERNRFALAIQPARSRLWVLLFVEVPGNVAMEERKPKLVIVCR